MSYEVQSSPAQRLLICREMVHSDIAVHKSLSLSLIYHPIMAPQLRFNVFDKNLCGTEVMYLSIKNLSFDKFDVSLSGIYKLNNIILYHLKKKIGYCHQTIEMARSLCLSFSWHLHVTNYSDTKSRPSV